MAKPPQRVRIFSPSQRATQSARGQEGSWILQFEPQDPPFHDSLTGWTGSSDMNTQVQIQFKTRAQAEAYAAAHGFEYEIAQPPKRETHHKSYADNFSRKRRVPWTH